MSIEAMKLMLHEMEYVLDCINNHVVPFDGDDFHEALRLGRQAIAEAEKQEPVAGTYWACERCNFACDKDERCPECGHHTLVQHDFHQQPAQPKREWVGLTAEEVERCKFNALNGTAWSMDVDIDLLVHEIGKKLKEKNT